ncbi:MAG: S41 family peptidase [Candidatus Omnitrophota bacterium]|nr:S41 family peptidase [Candidatus Omnitrophota bacterium]
MTKRFKIAFFIIAVMLVASLTMGRSEAPKDAKPQSKEDLYNQVELFSDAISVIRSEYVDEVDSRKVIYGALRGMLSSLDDFSQFMDQDEYKELTSEVKGEFGGIGVEITLKDGIITVITPMAGTPAKSAGIKPGDKIVRINGNTTKDIRLSDAVKIMRGEPGTQVTLTVWREKEDKVLDISIKRANVKIDSIEDARLIEGKIGYIRLVEFQERCARELEAALKKLEGEGMDSLILDLRNNPGGLLESAIDVSEKFIPKDGTIVSTKSRNPAQNAVYRSKGVLTHPSWPLIVLVNEGSASAAEIVAGAIQDNKRGVILGVKTFGKASVQTVIPLKDNSALRITTAYYFTPSGKLISNRGVIPDVVVEAEELNGRKIPLSGIFDKIDNDKEAKRKANVPKPKEPAVRDNQLERAVDLMKAIKVYKKL